MAGLEATLEADMAVEGQIFIIPLVLHFEVRVF